MQETIDLVKPFAAKGLRGIFHCFSGTADDARQITDMGFLLGIGGVITYKNGGLAEALAQTGLEHLVLETDAPYLSPVPFRGKRNESSYLPYIVDKLAEAKKHQPGRRSRPNHGQCPKNIRKLTPKSYFCSPLKNTERCPSG
jgi:TatD DNase family protein